MPAFRSFLFDLDGTLVDHFKAIHRCYAYTLPRVGYPAPTAQQVRDAIGGGLEHALSNFVPPEKIQEALAVYREYWSRTMLDDVTAMPGALELLEGLHAKGAVLAVLTNKHAPSSRLICDKLGFSPYLKATVGAGDTPWLKPQRELSEYALKLMGGVPESALLVGDSPFDIDAAHNGGFPCWVVTTGTHSAEELREAKADGILPNLRAIGLKLGLA
jgi:phosphoglycolate phosphatase